MPTWLLDPEIESLSIDQEFRQVEEFRNELFDIRRRIRTGQAPGNPNRMERAIGHIETAILSIPIWIIINWVQITQVILKVLPDSRVRV